MIVSKVIIDTYLPTDESVIREKKQVAIDCFEDRCSGCYRPYENGKGWAYHHMEYDERRKTHKDFPTTIKYNRYILGEVRTFPERFTLFCKPCHNRMDNFKTGMSLLPKNTLTRLYMIALLSKPKPRRTRGKGGESKPVSLSLP